jgi:hypothetical protein
MLTLFARRVMSRIKPIQGFGHDNALDLWTGGKAEPEKFPLRRSRHSALRPIHLELELFGDESRDRSKQAGTAHAVDCLVVARRTPTDAERLASFEMYRTSFKDVRIYTFDEVLLKLRALRDYLAPSLSKPAPSFLKGNGLF